MFNSLIVLFRSNLIVDRIIKFFSLPDCYIKMIKNKDCNKTRSGIAFDLLELFFSYKTFPVHYGQCRLWEVEKSEWKYYFGSILSTYQMLLLRKIQPREYDILFRDKAVCELLCRGIGINNIPRTYGIIGPDQNYKERIKSCFH
jgi:hypothetical protein